MKFKYPKITILIALILIAVFVFKNPLISDSINNFLVNLGEIGYIGFFVAGIFYVFSFSAPFAAGFLLVSNPENILFAGAIAGVGALISDMLIFHFIRFSFIDEFEELKRTKIIRKAGNILEKILGKKVKNYLLYLFAGIVIASPLPDEAGIIILAGLTKIRQLALMTISFIFNTGGIIIILYI